MRNIFAVFIFISLWFPNSAFAILGDVAPLGNPDGSVTLGDAVVAARMAAGLIPQDANADVAESGSSTMGTSGGGVTITDAWLLARSAIGLPTAADQTYTNSLGMIFKKHAPVGFDMGSSDGQTPREGDEKSHSVGLTESFYIQATEVTQGQWKAVMGTTPAHFGYCANCPVEQVSWNDVAQFLVALNARNEGTYDLPTEAQWEFAVRGGSTTSTYHFGEDANKLKDYAVYYSNSGSKTSIIASKLPNSNGLYDMYGNVSEWIKDSYSLWAYYKESWPESQLSKDGQVLNPLWPPDGTADSGLKSVR
ncbi:MAG TPA: SUMF1/EgtB/PvdO family nonheme iron enzyme, partial [Magnetococcales bacterium]|nr:SUMF1/EgtB/PvdO family nonheme iron enzyme [Magnetococcales bacterium]